MDSVWGSIFQLYGEFGASHTRLALIDYNMDKEMAVIRTSLATERMVRASLASIRSAGNKEMTVHVLAISGTIKALFAKL